MSDPPPPVSPEGSADARIAALEHRLAGLQQRFDDLERHLGLTYRPAVPRVEPSPVAPPPIVAPPRPRTLPWPFDKIGPEKLPVVLLASAGGLALSFGLLFFVWYAVEQGWLSPTTRLVLGGLVGIGLLGSAWPLATRHNAAAGALGGAGLGTWFAVWIVARHVHGFVGPTETFAGLVVACVAGLVMAGLRELRLMAVLAAIAAFVTPIATSTGADRLHELMVYQLALMVALVSLEHARRWPELGHLALTGAWSLVFAWAFEHLDPATEAKFFGWSMVLLGASTAQSLALHQRGHGRLHVGLRLGVGGASAWLAISMASGDASGELGGVTLGLAIWHLAIVGWLVRTGASVGVVAVPMSLAWAQLLAVGPIWFEEAAMASWWVAQATVAALLVLWRRGWSAIRLIIAPALLVIGWVTTTSDHAFGLVHGAVLCGGLLLIAAWPQTPEVEATARWPIACAVVVVSASLVLGVAGGMHLDALLRGAAALSFAIVPALAPVRARWHFDRYRALGIVVTHGLAAWLLAGSIVASDLVFAPLASEARLWTAVASILVAGAATMMLAVCRRNSGAVDRFAAASGLVVAASSALALQMLVSAGLHAWIGPDIDAVSLASISVVLAITALALLVAGLVLACAAWRMVALGGLGIVAIKVVFVDLAEVGLAYRVLSFVALGGCMIAGAIAYGRWTKTER